MIEKFITSLPIAHGEGNLFRDQPLERPLPAPIGLNCPDHPTFPLVWKGEGGWCRRGQHAVTLNEPQPIWAAAARAVTEGRLGAPPRGKTARPESTYEMSLEEATRPIR